MTKEKNLREALDEIEAVLKGAHAVMETVSGLERRVGTVGSHARGYTHKITMALKRLEVVAAAIAQPPAPEQGDTHHWPQQGSVHVCPTKDVACEEVREKCASCRLAATEQQAPQFKAIGSVHIDTLSGIPKIGAYDGGAKLWPVSRAQYSTGYVLVYIASPAAPEAAKPERQAPEA